MLRKKHQSGILYPIRKLPSKSEDFPDKQELRLFVASRPILQEMLRDLETRKIILVRKSAFYKGRRLREE